MIGRTAGIFSFVASFSTRKPLFVLLAASLVTIFAVLSLLRTPFSSDATKVIPSDTPALELIKDMMESFKLGGEVDLAVRGRSSSLSRFAAAVKEELAGSKDVSEVVTTYAEQYRIGNDPLFIARMILNLPSDALDRLIRFTEPAALDKVVARWKKDRARVPREALEKEPVLLRQIVAEALLQRSAPFWLTDSLRKSKDGEWLHVTIRGKRPSADFEFSRRISAEVDDAVKRAQERTSGIYEVVVAGGYSAAVSNHDAIKRDILYTISISAALVLAIFMYGFRRAESVLCVGLPLSMAVICSFGVCSAVMGNLYLGSAVFACILIGLGIDYPIHLYNQLSAELSRGLGWRDAIAEAAAKVGPGAAGAALTTVAAFGLFLFLPFRPLVELGAIASAGLTLCVIATFTVLPALLSLFDGRFARTAGAVRRRSSFVPRITGFASAHARAVCAAALAMVIASGAVFFLRGYPGIPFTFEMGRFVPTSPEDAEKRQQVEELFPSAVKSSLLIAWRAPDLTAAFKGGVDVMQMLEPLRGSLISDYFTPLRLFGDTATYRENLKRARDGLAGPPLEARLEEAIRRAGEDPAYFESSRRFLSSLREALSNPEIESQLGDLGAPMWSSSFAPSDGGFIGIVPIAVDPMKQNPYDQSRIAAKLEKGLTELPGDGASLSGWLVLEREIVALLKRDLAITMLAGAIVVMLVSFVLFRRPLPTALALTPVVFALAVTLGFMKIAGIDFNYLTVAAFPIIVGVSVDSGIHLVHRMSSARGDLSADPFSITGRAVLFTTLTTVSAFGSFVTSWNVGLREFGWTFNVGLVASLLASLLLLPAI
ncbi:MAG TPA: MMPL family transporter, partial [bacterium]|nr:MMPL family transporter [bacterium]